MIRNRFLPAVLIGCILTAGMPVTAVAEEVSAVSGSAIEAEDLNQEPTKQGLENIIKAVKAMIPIPKELTEFEYYFNAESSYSSAYWSLNWHDKDYKKQIQVQVDQDGHLVSYSLYKDRNGYDTPEYLKSELESKAESFIKKVAPDISGKIEYVKAEQQGIYSGEYRYQFQRVENGIKMPDNTVTVGINYETGEAVYYNSSWLYDVEIPSAEVSVTKAEAAKKIGKSVKMKLSYQNAYKTDKNGNGTVKAFLVYSPDTSYIAVDAKTGEVYTTQNEWITRNESEMYDQSLTGSAKNAGAGGLTEQEILEVEGLEGIISREDAIKAVTGNKYLLLDKNLKNTVASLYKQSSYNQNKKAKYVWNISMSDPREIDYTGNDTYRAYAYASVDAETGKLISFSSSVKDIYSMNQKELDSLKVKYTQEQGQAFLEDFLKSQIPDKLKNSVLTDNRGSYIIAYKDSKEVYGGYSYQYDRTNEGISYPYNGIYGSVDGMTGKIYSFSYNWDDNVSFESPDNIISADRAFDCYIANDGYGLVYEINNVHIIDNSISPTKEKVLIAAGVNSYSRQSEIRLVYRTDITPSYISPFTGKQLSYDGEEYSGDQDLYSYNDIKDHESERRILLLADNGIGFKGGRFLPDQAITRKELCELLSLASLYYNNDQYKLDDNNSTITRMEAARFVIRISGYDKLAGLESVYRIDFKDKDKISEDDIGYAALANGLKLIICNGGNEFEPDADLTRAEAADMIFGMFTDK